MKAKILKTPSLKIYPARKDSKTSVLVARSYFNKQTFTQSLKVSVPPKSWLKSRMMVNNRLSNAHEVNKYIREYENKFKDVAEKLAETGRLNLSNLKRAMNQEANSKNDHNPQNIFDLIENEFIKSKLGLKENTIKSYHFTGVFLKSFVKDYYKRNAKELTLSEMNHLDFYADIMAYMKQRGNTTQTKDKYIKHIKAIMKYADNKGYLDNSQYKEFKRLKITKTQPVYLTLDEIDQIKHTEMPTKTLESVKDWLLISCFTGLRKVDIYKMNKNQMSLKNKRINDINVKTGVYVSIPMHKIVEEIIVKRNGDLPEKPSKNTYNRNLKSVCKIAQINTKVYTTKQGKVKNYPKHELTSSHIGRSSLATNCYKEKWLSLEKLALITGHGSVEMLLNYIAIDKDEVAEELDEKWNK